MAWPYILRETPDMPDELINIMLSMVFNMAKEAKVYNIINMSFSLSKKGDRSGLCTAQDRCKWRNFVTDCFAAHQ